MVDTCLKTTCIAHAPCNYVFTFDLKKLSAVSAVYIGKLEEIRAGRAAVYCVCVYTYLAFTLKHAVPSCAAFYIAVHMHAD